MPLPAVGRVEGIVSQKPPASAVGEARIRSGGGSKVRHRVHPVTGAQDWSVSTDSASFWSAAYKSCGCVDSRQSERQQVGGTGSKWSGIRSKAGDNHPVRARKALWGQLVTVQVRKWFGPQETNLLRIRRSLQPVGESGVNGSSSTDKSVLGERSKSAS